MGGQCQLSCFSTRVNRLTNCKVLTPISCGRRLGRCLTSIQRFSQARGKQSVDLLLQQLRLTRMQVRSAWTRANLSPLYNLASQTEKRRRRNSTRTRPSARCERTSLSALEVTFPFSLV